MYEYESPILIVASDMYTEIVKQRENNICTAIQNVGIDVNKEELIKALKYDRDQYEQGYRDALKTTVQKHGRWEKWWCEDYITYFHRCSVCGEDALTKEETAHDEVLSNYCPNCGAKMDGEV